MVLMNASKRARHVASVVNQTNTCGGVDKGGLPPSIGRRSRGGNVYSRATPPPVSYACPIGGVYHPSLGAVNNGVVGTNRNSPLLYTKHIPSTVADNKVLYWPVQVNKITGGVGRYRNVRT